MSHVTRHVEDHSSRDRLDGDDLRDGEWLAVTFPDGFTQDATVEIESLRQAQGHAYCTGYFHGVRVRVPLLGLLARRLVVAS